MSTRDPLAWLTDAAHAREQAGLRRALRTRTADERELDLAGNDYLGLSGNPDVIEAGVSALRTWGAGSTGSRLVTGSTSLHAELDAALARFVGAEAGLVCATGYAANLAAVTALSGPGSLVVSDRSNHASIVDACRLSRARVVVTAHNDVTAVAAALAEREEERAVVVTDSLFSVEGDLAPLADLHAVCRAQGALLLTDEAHALGVLGDGRGAVHAAGLAGEPDVVQTVTLSKALGAQGGAVLGRADVIAHLVDTARAVIFDTGLAPAPAASALEALRIVERTPALVTAVRQRAAAIADIVGVPVPAGAVVSVVLGDPERAVGARDALAEHGVRVGCFRPPSVPIGRSCVRLTARADLTDDDLDLLAKVWRATGVA
ncbi:MAG TPA: 8-amino-7-oxononanoate synthase [Mycobacteriales bacterium]|nr:8-amino-7-oxononanoate synthase [Mycobacteriales bacterium]